MKALLIAIVLAGAAFPQAGSLDYRSQVKNKPISNGSGAPSNPCPYVGNLYNRTDNATQYYCPSTGGTWTIISSGGGGGVGAAYQLTDFQVTKTSGTVETVNGSAGSTAPVIGRVGQTSFVFTSAATATISGSSSTGTVRWCLRNDGSLAVAHNLAATITGSGLTVITSAAACPATSIQLWATTMTANVWDAVTESMDTRSFLSYKPSPTAGAGIAVTAGSTDVIAADTTILAQKFFGTTAPGSVSGNLPGDFYTDTTAKHMYECQAVAGTAAPACTSVTANGWTQIDGGGGGSSSTAVYVPFTWNRAGSAGDSNNVWTTGGTWVTFEDTTTWTGMTVRKLQSQTNSGSISWPFIFPASLSNLTVVLENYTESTSGNTVILTGAVQCEAPGSAIGSGSFGTGSAATTTGVTSGQWFSSTLSAISTSGCAAGNQAFLRITRSGTYTANVDFFSMRVTFTP